MSTSRAITSSGSASSPAASRTGTRSPSPATIGCSTARTGATTTLSGPPSCSPRAAPGCARRRSTAIRCPTVSERGESRSCGSVSQPGNVATECGGRNAPSAAVRSSASRAVAVTASTNRPGPPAGAGRRARRDEQRAQRGRRDEVALARCRACRAGCRVRYGAGDLRLRRRVVRRGSCCPKVAGNQGADKSGQPEAPGAPQSVPMCTTSITSLRPRAWPTARTESRPQSRVRKHRALSIRSITICLYDYRWP